MDGTHGVVIDPLPVNGPMPADKGANVDTRDKGAFPFPDTDSTPQLLAFFVTAGFFGLLYLLCFKSAPDANLAMMNIVVGSLGTAWVGIVAYYFGSNHTGPAKDKMLYQSQPILPPK
jgi:hypothetical protein